MDVQNDKTGTLFETIDGGHLHWSDFRDNILQSFRIKCTASSKADELPTTFLARLQAAQKNPGLHDFQRQAWRAAVTTGRGISTSAVFPRDLVPQQHGSNKSLRLMTPQMSREGLPLRSPPSPGIQGTLYELPTARPVFVFGFDMASFSKAEQAQLQGPLHVTGVSVDFEQGETLPARSLCCPYLMFEKFFTTSEEAVETARNSCAVAGAQCLKGQQQLFHKAFGLQTVSQPPITFTCALNNETAIINLHYIGDDGCYCMAALCRFDLQKDAHFNTFQAWIEAIDSWAIMYLLPRLQSAITQVVRSYPSPPPSPTPTTCSQLSIDTRSSHVFSIVKELRRLYPAIRWKSDQSGDTPINSCGAQCGTPLPTRHTRGLALPAPTHSEGMTPIEGPVGGKRNLFPSPKFVRCLSPIHTRQSAFESTAPRSSAQPRMLFSPGSSFALSDGSSTPISPCRPASLSPCSPGPEMPMRSMNPMLVLQKRLEVACTEIQELRLQVDDLQGQLNKRTDKLELMLQAMSERQDKSQGFALGCNTAYGFEATVEDDTEQELKTPTASDPMPHSVYASEHLPPLDAMCETMPGTYGHENEEETLDESWPILIHNLLFFCRTKLFTDSSTQIWFIACSVFASFCLMDYLCIYDLAANLIMMTLTNHQYNQSISKYWRLFLESSHKTTQATTGKSSSGERGVDVLVEVSSDFHELFTERLVDRNKARDIFDETYADDEGMVCLEELPDEDGAVRDTECVPIVLY